MRNMTVTLTMNLTTMRMATPTIACAQAGGTGAGAEAPPMSRRPVPHRGSEPEALVLAVEDDVRRGHEGMPRALRESGGGRLVSLCERTFGDIFVLQVLSHATVRRVPKQTIPWCDVCVVWTTPVKGSVAQTLSHAIIGEQAFTLVGGGCRVHSNVRLRRSFEEAPRLLESRSSSFEEAFNPHGGELKTFDEARFERSNSSLLQ